MASDNDIRFDVIAWLMEKHEPSDCPRAVDAFIAAIKAKGRTVAGA